MMDYRVYSLKVLGEQYEIWNHISIQRDVATKAMHAHWSFDFCIEDQQ